MEFLAKAAAIVVSVLASVFTNVKPHEAQVQHASAPSMRHASFVKAEVPELPSIAIPESKVVAVFEGERSKIVVVQPVAPVDDEFFSYIKAAHDPKRIPERKPWYMAEELFTVPSPTQAAEVLRALVSGNTADQ